jgi:hypothetical protein
MKKMKILGVPFMMIAVILCIGGCKSRKKTSNEAGAAKEISAFAKEICNLHTQEPKRIYDKINYEFILKSTFYDFMLKEAAEKDGGTQQLIDEAKEDFEKDAPEKATTCKVEEVKEITCSNIISVLPDKKVFGTVVTEPVIDKAIDETKLVKCGYFTLKTEGSGSGSFKYIAAKADKSWGIINIENK